MLKKVGKSAIMVMVGTSLLGGIFVEAPNALSTTQAQAAAKIPNSTYVRDLSGIKAALGKASSDVQAGVASSLPSAKEYRYAYTSWNWPSFHDYLDNLASSIEGHTNTKATARANYDCMVATYNIFKKRLSSGAQSQLEALANNLNQEINATNGSSDFYDIADQEEGYVHALEAAVLDYGGNYDGVAGSKSSAKHSYISKLSVKKTGSKKYVKVTGTAKLYKSANYAHIHTYKGYRYVKLSSKHTFSKTIYAPKAKTITVNAGYYSHGHYKAVTSTKTAHVK